MPSFLSICLNLLRIAILITNVIQGVLIELLNAVECLRDGQYSSTLSTEDQSSNLSLTEPSTSDAVNAEPVAPSTQLTGSSDFTEISSTGNVFERLDMQSTPCESGNNSESLISNARKIENDLEDYSFSKQPVSCTNYCDTSKDNNSSKFQENEMSKSSPNEPGAPAIPTTNVVSVSEDPSEVVPLDTSLYSETADDNSKVEASNVPAVNSSPVQVETLPSERLGNSIHSTSSVQDSQICVSPKESNIDVALEVTTLSEKPVYEPILVSNKSEFHIELNIERNLFLRDYDTSTLREKEPGVKSPVCDSSTDKSMGDQDIDFLQGAHSPVEHLPSKRTSGSTPIKPKENLFIAAALDQSLGLPRFRVDRSTGDVQWKTDIPQDSTSEPKESSSYKEDGKTTASSYNESGFQCEFQETSTTEGILYKPIQDRVPTPPPKFQIAESSTDNEHPEDTQVKSNYECTGASAAQSEFKPVAQRKLTPAARFPNRLSTDAEEDNEAGYDHVQYFRLESPTIAEAEFKSTRERRPTPLSRIIHHDQISSSGTESGIFSEPNNLTIFIPLREESRPPPIRSPLKSQESSQDASVGFTDQPSLTKNDRIDSIEKIESVIKPTCGFLSPEAILYPQTVSETSTPLTIDSNTPENIRYIKKASQLLETVSTQCDKEQEYCDINSSATEFPVSGSSSATDSEDAIRSENLPQLLVESPSSTENDKSPLKEFNTSSSVRFLLPESHIERESRGIRKEAKFRKPPNETSTSVEENEIKLSRKRRASPGKLYKSPKKLAETTASRIRGYKFSPQKTYSEKKREDGSSCESTTATQSLDFELGIQQKSENITTLLTSVGQKNLTLESEEHAIPRIFEDQVTETANSQLETFKSENEDDISSKTDSISETTSSARVGDDIAEETAPEGTEGFSPKIGTDEPSAVAGCVVNSDEKRNYFAPEFTKGVFPSFVNETFALLENAVDSEADFTIKDHSSNNSLLKGSTYSDKSSKISCTGHLELVDANKSSKLPETDELASDQNNEKRIDEKKNAQLESTSNIHWLSEDEQKSNCNVQPEATNQATNDDSSKRSTSSESTSGEESINETSGSDSSHEEAESLASQLEKRAEFEESSNADRNEDKNSTEDKSESPKFSTSDKPTDKKLVKDSTLEAGADNFSVLKEVAHQINTVVNVDDMVEMDKTCIISQSKTVEVEPPESMEVSNNSSHPVTIDSQSKDQILETEQQLEVELSSFNDASFSSNRISVLSPIYEVSANGTASSGSYSESEAVISIPSASSASEDGDEDLEEESSLSESPHSISSENGHGSSEPENEFSNSSQMSTSKGQYIQLDTPSIDPAVQSSRIEKGTCEIHSETETVSSLLSPNEYSNSEVDEESTISKVAEETSYELTSLSTNLKKDRTSKSYFSPVLEELVQRIRSASRSNSPTQTLPFLSSLEVEDRAEVSSDLQISTAFKTNAKKVYNVKNYFDPVLKELVQRVKPTTVSDSFTSIKDENSSVAKIEVPLKPSIQTSPTQDFTEGKNSSIHKLSNDIIQNVIGAQMNKSVDTVHPNNFMTGAENIKEDNLDFELHIVPQPVPCEIAIDSKVLILGETSAGQNEIKIVDTKTPENELNVPDVNPAKSTICQLTAKSEDEDSYSMHPVDVVSNESATGEILPSNRDRNSSMSSIIEAFVEVTRVDSAAYTDGLTENASHKITKNDSFENSLETTHKYHTENTPIKITKKYSSENIVVGITKDDSAEKTLVETTKEDSTECTLVEVSEDDPTQNNNVENTICSNTFVGAENNDYTENNFVEVMHDCSVERSAMNASTNLDSSFAEEVNANDKEESSQENKPWKKKQRKSKKKRRI